MDHHLNPVKTGLAVGTLVGTLHLIWILFVMFGWAQAIVTFSMWAHMVSSPMVVKAFDFSAAITLIVVATIIGYIVGFLFARIWNRTHRG